MDALIYCRNSKGVERSVEEQEAESRAECARNGWAVTEVVTDLVGASRHSRGTREGWARAQDVIRSGKIDVLVTWEASRASRDLAAYAELRQLCSASGVKWAYAGRVYDMADSDDRFRTGLDALVAEREADDISTRVKRAVRARAAAGMPHGRRLFGYRRIYDDKTGRPSGQVVDPEEAAVVLEVFVSYLAGTPVHAIARALNKRGVKTAAGAAWNDMKVRRLLSRESYAGRRVLNGEVIRDAVWPAIIDPATFDRAQARLAASMLANGRQTKTASLLAGIARCGRCGGPVRREGRSKYACVNGWHVSRDRDALDLYVTKRLLERLATIDDRPPEEDTRGERAVIDACRARIDGALAEFLAGKMTAAMLSKVEQDQLAVIRRTEAALRQRTIRVAVDVPDPARIGVWWTSLLPAQKRAVGAAFIEAVTIHPTYRGSRQPLDETIVVIEWR